MLQPILSSRSVLRVFLVDDAPVVRKGLHSLLATEPSWLVCGEADGEQAALAGIVAARPHLAFIDLCLAEGAGISLIKRLHRLCPALKIVVFSDHEEVSIAASAFEAGAHGYLLKDEGAEQILQAVAAVRDRGYYLSSVLAAKAPGLVSARCLEPVV